jgi:hypothetical protein
VNDPAAQRLTREQLLALKFAAHRQLARWARSRPLTPRQQQRRSALVHAVRALEHPTLAGGCTLRPANEGER